MEHDGLIFGRTAYPVSALWMKEAATLAEATAASGIDQPEIQLDAMREINEKTVENNLDDSTITTSDVAPYLSIPLEIRLMISKEILEHGEIQILPQPDFPRVDRLRVLHDLCHGDPACPISAHLLQDTDPDRAPGPNSLPGYQILATCKQAYKEGVVAFYTKNTFYLPPGPVEHSINYFNGLTRETRTMIQKIGIRFGVEDLVPIITPRTEVALGFEDEWMAIWKDDKLKRAEDHVWLKRLRQTWSRKLLWIRQWTTVQEFKLDFRPLEKTFDLNLQQLNDYLNDAEFHKFAGVVRWDPYSGPYYVNDSCYNLSESILVTASNAVEKAYNMIQAKIHNEGWVKCREWIVAERQNRLSLSD